ncbi:hypothetical protein AB0D57_47295 [Streptomyces sp. NPDC048275]|uniref:hypothetical protein n=1 Tax=Streptomyces sp. NPDC048275 TaxID=3155629 RepID=UPI0033E9E08F
MPGGRLWSPTAATSCIVDDDELGGGGLLREILKDVAIDGGGDARVVRAPDISGAPAIACALGNG